MGHHVTLTGDVLQVMRDDLGMIDDSLAKRVIDWSGKCSRIDIAIDCFGASFGPADLNDALQDGSAKIRARTWRFIDGHRTGVHGSTVDTGSQKSDVRLRFYDKRAEKRIKDGDAWVRLELQLRRMYARASMAGCAAQGTSIVATSVIGSYLTWSNSEYLSALADNGEFTMQIPRGLSKRRKWLLGQVAKALASETYNDIEFLSLFMIALGNFEDHYHKLDYESE